MPPPRPVRDGAVGAVVVGRRSRGRRIRRRRQGSRPIPVQSSPPVERIPPPPIRIEPLGGRKRMVDESAIPVSEWSCVRSPIIYLCDVVRCNTRWLFAVCPLSRSPLTTTTTTTTPHHAHIPRDDDRPTDRLTNDTPPKQKDESRGGAVGPRTGAGRGGVRAPPRVVVGVGSCGCGRGLEPRRRRHPHGRAVQSRGLVRGYRRRRREGIGDREGSAGAGIQLHGPQVRDGGAVVVVVVYP